MKSKRLSKNNFLRVLLFSVLLVLLLGVFVWPFWTGDVIRSNGTVIPSARVEIPGYYLEAANWLNSLPGDFNVLSIPVVRAGSLPSYSWQNGTQGYFGAEPGVRIFSKPLIYTAADANDAAKDLIQLLDENNSDVATLMSLMNIRYILFHNDFHPVLSEVYSIPSDPVRIRDVLDSSNAFELDRTFGELSFYQNKMWKPCQLTANKHVAVMIGESKELNNLIMTKELINKYTLLTFGNVNLYLSSMPSFSQDFPIYFTEKTGEFNQTIEIYVHDTGKYMLKIEDARAQENFENIIKLDNRSITEYADNVQIEKNNSSIIIHSLTLNKGFHYIDFSVTQVSLPVSDGWINPINWSMIQGNYAARSFFSNGTRWKPVVSTNGASASDTIDFASPNSAPYEIPAFSNQVWQVNNATLIYLSTGRNESEYIDQIYVDGKPLNVNFDYSYWNYNLNAWWESGFMGRMGVDVPPSFPIIIPPHQKAILAIKTDEIPTSVSLMSYPIMPEYVLMFPEENSVSDAIVEKMPESIAFNSTQLNPTEYLIEVDATSPFYLSLQQLYNANWKAYVNGVEIGDENHFMGYLSTNVWFVNTAGKLSIHLQFQPQQLFYMGLFLSITSAATSFVLITRNNRLYRYLRIRIKRNTNRK